MVNILRNYQTLSDMVYYFAILPCKGDMHDIYVMVIPYIYMVLFNPPLHYNLILSFMLILVIVVDIKWQLILVLFGFPRLIC